MALRHLFKLACLLEIADVGRGELPIKRAVFVPAHGRADVLREAEGIGDRRYVEVDGGGHQHQVIAGTAMSLDRGASLREYAPLEQARHIVSIPIVDGLACDSTHDFRNQSTLESSSVTIDQEAHDIG